MDAVKFIEERGRMCKAMNGDCNQPCPITNWCGRGLKRQADFAPAIVSAVEEWAAAHPRKTRQSVLLNNYPCARIDRQSVLYTCPADVCGYNVCPRKKDTAPITCSECRREFWLKEVE